MALNQKFNRRRFLINYKLQLSIVSYFLFLGIAVAVGNYYLVSRAFEGYLYEFRAGLAGFTVQDIPLALDDLQKNIINDLWLASVLGMVGIFLGGILVSHRIAGPMYNLSGAMKAFLKTGELKLVRLRKHDFGHEIADLYNQVLEKKAK